MDFCASFHTHSELLNEIRYPISRLDMLIEALMERPTQNYILEIWNFNECGLSLKKLQDICAENANVSVDTYEKQDFVKLSQQIPRIMYHYPVTTFNDLQWLLTFHPCSITIGEPLLFDLINVRKVVNNNTQEGKYIRLRALPAIGRPSEWNIIYKQIHDDGTKHFWLPPQFIHIYEPYLDVLDLYDRDIEREKILVKLYTSGTCGWALNALLKNCECVTPCDILEEQFIERRLNCRQKCMLAPGACDYCYRETRFINAVIASQSNTV